MNKDWLLARDEAKLAITQGYPIPYHHTRRDKLISINQLAKAEPLIRADERKRIGVEKMTNEQVREQIAVLLESLIGKTWVELLENAPEVMFAQHDIDIHTDQILSLLQPPIDQAGAEERAETATDIGEALCILVGNMMLEDMETGKKLGAQVKPILDYCKSLSGQALQKG